MKKNRYEITNNLALQIMIAQQISRCRFTLKLTQTNVTQRLGLNDSYLSRWENQLATMPLNRLIEIALLFGVRLEDLVTEGQICPKLTGYKNSGREKAVILSGIGDRISEQRKKQGLELNHLALVTGLSETSVAKWGSSNIYPFPTCTQAYNLSRLFKIDIDHLLPILDYR